MAVPISDMKKKIAIDITPLQSEDSFRGIGRVVQKIVEKLLKDGPFLRQYDVVLVKYQEQSIFDHYNKIHVLPSRVNGKKLLHDFLTEQSIDLYHCYKDLLPDKKPEKTIIVTEHYDVIPLLICDEPQLKRSKTQFAGKYFPGDSFMGRSLYYLFLSALNLGLFHILERRGRRQFKNYLDETVRMSDYFICISESARRDFLRYYPGIHAGDARVVPLGVDAVRVSRGDGGIPDRFGLTKGEYFYYMGGFDHRKNIQGLLEIFSIFLARNSGYRSYKLVMIGKYTGMERYLACLISRYGLRERVVLTGYLDDREASSIMTCSKLFLFASLYEGFGLPVLEAMVAGVPAVAYANSSIPEVAGDACALVRDGDKDAFVAAMERMLRDKHSYGEYRKKGLRQAKRFTWEATVKELKSVYRDIVE